MLFIGLVITSVGFTIPSFIAFRRKKKQMGILCSILSGTSILYHGTQKAFFKYIDIAYAHSLGSFYFIQSIARCFIHKRLYDVFMFTGTLSSILLFYKGPCNNKLTEKKKLQYHMLFHMCSQSMMCLHAIDSK